MGLGLSLTTLLMPSPYKDTTYRMNTVKNGKHNSTNTQLNLNPLEIYHCRHSWPEVLMVKLFIVDTYDFCDELSSDIYFEFDLNQVQLYYQH